MFPYFGIALICFAVLFVLGFIYCCRDKRAVRAGGSFSATKPVFENSQSVSIQIEDSATEPPSSREREEVERSRQINRNGSRLLSEKNFCLPAKSTRKNRSRPNSWYPELDLHGYNKSEACQEARDFYIRCCSYNDCEGFVIITGKGNHSENGPQIKPAILNLATQLGWNNEIDENNEGRINVYL